MCPLTVLRVHLYRVNTDLFNAPPALAVPATLAALPLDLDATSLGDKIT